MKEYSIHILKLHVFNDIDLAKIKLFDMIFLEEERQRPYFVDNKFFNNKYNITRKLKYFCIREREVSKWKNYSGDDTKVDKIIFLILIFIIIKQREE